MDDNNQNQNENQPAPIFETVTSDSQPVTNNEPNLQPEEISSEVTSPDQVIASSPPGDIPPEEQPMVYEENKSKYLIIAGGAIFFLIIFVLIFFLVFRGGGAANNKPVKLVYWGLWEDKEIFDPLIKQYQAQNKNITIEYMKMVPQEYREKLIARSKNGQGPDIFRFHNTWLREIKDVVSPLPASVMTNEQFEKTFYPVHQKDLKNGDYYYGLPLEIDGLVLIGNEGLLKKAGIATMPNNWDEVVTDVAKLSVRDTGGNLITAGIALGTASNIEHFSDIFGLILLQNGGNLENLNDEAAAGALESYRKFAEDPKTGFWDETMPNSLPAFIQEKVALIIAPSWVVMNIKAANPDIKIKVASIPIVPGGKPLSLANYWVEGVSRNSNNQLEAWKFLRYLVEKENLTKLYENESKVRLFGEPYSRVDLASSLAQHEYLGPVIQQANYYVSLPLISRTYDNGLNDEIVRYIENAINATAQGTAYSEALNTAQQGVSQVLGRYVLQ